jgi:hypothetical protein
VAHAALHLALAIRVADPRRQRDRAVVAEQIAEERVQDRVVDLRLDDALTQVVEDETFGTPPSRRKARSWSSA